MFSCGRVHNGLAYYEEDNDWGALALGSMMVRNAIERSNPYFEQHDIVRSAVSAIRHANPVFLEQHLAEFDDNTAEGRRVRQALAILDADPQDFARRAPVLAASGLGDVPQGLADDGLQLAIRYFEDNGLDPLVCHDARQADPDSELGAHWSLAERVANAVLAGDARYENGMIVLAMEPGGG